MNELDIVQRVIADRRSVFPKAFSSDLVTDEIIEQMLESANWAPSHKLTEPWRFHVVRDEALARLAHFMAEKYREDPKGGHFLQKKYDSIKAKVTRSSAVIIICMQRDPEERVPEWEEQAAVAMAVQNMSLRGWSLGVGGYWSTPPFRKAIHEFIDLSAGESCLGFFYLGHFAQAGQPPVRSPWQEKVQWIRE